MKLILNLLNGLTSHSANKHSLKTCLLATSLLIVTPAYALDGEGWGAIIKGVTEILHNNQQQEIKEREEQQRLEQQRLQEQQAEQLRQQQLQVSNVNTGQPCNHKFEKVDIPKKWTGNCLNGYLYGEGELFILNLKTGETERKVGKFNDGYPTGVSINHRLEKNGQIIEVYPQILGYFENDKAKNIPVAVEINNRLQSYTYKDLDWYTLTTDFSSLDRKISFEEAMQIVKNFMATKAGDTMSYERFRAYLEGKLSFDPAQKVAQQTDSSTSTSTESTSEVTDDPPQKGIFLDRRQKSATKKKK